MTEDAPPLIPDQRREKLLKYLRRDGVLSVQQITQLFGVSHMTVRRDIAELERQGLVFTVPGGVRIASQVRSEPSHQAKTQVEQPQKEAMASRAASLVEDGMTLYLDAGTTLLAVVPHLVHHERLTVVSNDFSTVDRLMTEAPTWRSSTSAARSRRPTAPPSAGSPQRPCATSPWTWPSSAPAPGTCCAASPPPPTPRSR